MSATAGEIVIQLTLDGKEMALQVRNAGQLLRQFQSTLGATAKSVKRLDDAHHSLTTKFRHLILTLGNLRFAMLDVYDVFLRLPAQILNTAGELERIQQLMKGLSTQADEAARKVEGAASFKYLVDSARAAPFALEALAESFVKLKSGGVDPMNGSMRALVDSVAKFGGNSDSLKRASIAIQQMAGKGVVSMEELRQQLGEAVPDAIQAMATGMRLAMPTLVKEISKGTVEASSAIQKMLAVMNLRNRGAAEDMMQTWVGALAQLKTEWQIAAKSIAESGFGEESLAAVKDLTSALNTKEFRTFATDFGKALGDTVRLFADAVKAAVEYRDVILTLVQGFILYKASTKLLQPALESVAQGLSKAKAGWIDYDTNLKRTAASNAKVAQDAVAAAARQAQAVADGARISIAAKQAEAAQLTALYKRQQAEMIAQTALSKPVREIKPGIFEVGGNEAAVKRVKELNKEMAQTSGALLANSLATDAQRRSMQAATVAAAGHTATLGAMTVATKTLTVATTAMNLVMKGLIATWRFLTAPLFLINAAITIGSALWFKYAGAIREADGALRRLRQGTSTEKDVQDANEALQLIIDKRASQQKILEGIEKTPSLNPARKEELLRLARAEMAKLDQQFVVAQAKLTATKRNVAEQAGKEEADDYMTQTDRMIGVIKDRNDGLLAAERQRFLEMKQAAKGNAKLLQKAEEEEAASLAKIGISDANARERELRDALKRVNGRPDISVAGRQEIIKRLNEQIRQAQNDRINAESILTKNIFVKTDTPTGEPLKTPIERFVDDMEEQRARLESELQGYATSFNKVDKVAAALAAFDATKDSAFKYKVKKEERNAGGDELDKARALVKVVAAYGVIADDAKKITDVFRAIEPDYQNALEVIADPLQGKNLSPRYNKIEEMTTQLRNLREEMVRSGATGPAAEAIKKSIAALEGALNGLGKKAATIDFAGLYQRLVAQNRELSVSTIQNSRERIKKQRQMDDEAAEATIAALKKQLDRMELTQEEYNAKIAEMEENRRLRGVAANQELETPMRKMLIAWTETTEAMEAASAQWLDATVDGIVNMVRTGKLEWKGLVDQILSDILKIILRKQVANMMMSFGFADGGIMSSAGAVPLRKYAAGGIAKSPQVAVFGEGRMNEAYVPLPDGRTIPVTMNGGGGGDVTVNVINQTGQPVTAQQSSQPRFDGKQMILDVVLSAASQPGQFRDGMRQMVGSR